MDFHNKQEEVVNVPMDELDFNDFDDDESDAAALSSNPQDDDSSKEGSDDGSDEFAKSETKAVMRLRLVVMVVLLGSATVVAVSVYHYLTNSEERVFHKQFRDDAHKLLDGVGSTLAKTIGLCDNLATSLVTMAAETNQTFPFVTMPNFAVKMSKFVPLTASININVFPIVTPETRREWETYSKHHDGWVNEGMRIQEGWHGYYGPIIYNGTHNGIIHSDWADLEDDINRTMLPSWQNFPVIPNSSWTYNYDWLSSSLWDSYSVCINEHKAVVSEPYMIPKPDDAIAVAEADIWAEFYSMYIPPEENSNEPMSDIVYPVINEFDRVHVVGGDDYNPSEHPIVMMLAASTYWRSMIRNILPNDSDGIHIVFDNPCTDSFTYQVNGPKEQYLGVGDYHDKKYDHLGIHRTLHEATTFAMRDSVYSGAKLSDGLCAFTLHVYPSDVMKAAYITHNPIVFTVAGLLIFAFTSLIFYLYDAKVERRQEMVLRSATQSSAIVSSLFPTAVRDRLYPVTENEPPKRKMEGFMPGTANFRREGTKVLDSSQPKPNSGSPIAELYPETTVLFADIAGFTAWSSTRQPGQVFHLLESLYASYDDAAKKRGIFKVETIGDCYVAVAGLPTPRKNHAVVMAKFASHIRNKTIEVVAELEKTLGPGTADLAIRVGLNSGPTTAGVLRGEKSRFQLFGDTVNTASRMESNGERNRIQVSQKTAELLEEAGKGHWLTQRKEKVDCKGKGMMTTYWCEPSTATASEAFAVDDAVTKDGSPSQALLKRLVDWNVDLFTGLLNEIVESRNDMKDKSRDLILDVARASTAVTGKPAEEVMEELKLPKRSMHSYRVPGDVQIGGEARDQLQMYISMIADLYQANPFHNFEHCSHVVMSAKKLLDRITKQKEYDTRDDCSAATTLNQNVCDLLSDPLTQFAIIFAALIHDVDHPGVSNAQLIQEHHHLARMYNDKSIAEQNSIDIAWNLLMQEQFAALQQSLFASESDLRSFRQIVVYGVMGTDLFDHDLRSMRNVRWNKSFDSQNGSLMDCDRDDYKGDDDSYRRATIVVELIIQASDVSHTMQHFTVYKKWNMSLLSEMYTAYRSGRSQKNPLESWYEGELWFYDNYIIPLAKKLKECGVFGVSCDEFLDYAKDNRLEWELKGRTIVEEAAEALQQQEIAADVVRQCRFCI